MNKYYYLIPSLPEPVLEKEGDHFPTEDFLLECRKWLDEKEMKALLSAKRDNVEIADRDIPAVRRWKDFERSLREELYQFRSARRAEEGGKAPSERVSRITERDTPLDMELALERMRWDELSGMELGFFFDINRLALYFLKLQIAERVAGFDKDRGEKIFYEQCEVRYDRTAG